MHCVSFDIAGHGVVLNLQDASLMEQLGNLAPFVAGKVTPVFTLTQVGAVPETPDEILLENREPGFPRISIGRLGDGWFMEMAPLPDLPTAARMVAKDDFSEAEFQILSSPAFAVNNSMMLLFAMRTAPLGTLEVHASTIMNDGKGYLFLAPSGTGKSTHSQQWLKYIPGSELLNDDNPIVRLLPDGSVRVYGSPWSGKTPCYKKMDVPAGAFVRIRRAPENKITRLSVLESYASLYSSCSAFRPVKTIADGLHATISTIVGKVPCYVLDCLPDRGAAETCYNEVHG